MAGTAAEPWNHPVSDRRSKAIAFATGVISGTLSLLSLSISTMRIVIVITSET